MNETFAKIKNVFLDLFFPQCCCICGEVIKGFSETGICTITLDGKTFESPYCQNCTARLKKSYGPWIRKTRVRGNRVFYLFDYSDETMKRAIRHIKTVECKKCRRFFAMSAKKTLDSLVADGSILTFIPRSRKLFGKYGFDQSECVINEYIELGGKAKFISLFNRGTGKFKNMPQKKLNFKQRFENAQSSLSLKETDVLPVSVVIFDDIITTGATADAVTTLLNNAGVNNVKMFFLAEAPQIK